MIRSSGTARLGIGIALLLLVTGRLLATEPLAKTPEQSEVADPEESARNLELARKALDEGLRLYGRQDGASAIPHLERSLTLFENALGPRDLRTIFVLRVLGKVYADQHGYAGAIHYLEEAIDRAGTDGQARADFKLAALWELGRVNLLANFNEEAEKNLEEARALKLDVRKERDLDAARLLYYLATAQKRLGRRDDAHRTLSDAWSIYTTAPGDDPELGIEILDSLSRSHLSRGEAAEALVLLKKQRVLCESKFGPESLQTAATLDLIAAAHEMTGDFRSARDYLNQVSEIFEELTGRDRIYASGYLRALAVLAMNVGELDEAEKHAKRYLTILLETRDSPVAFVTDARCTLAAILVMHGNYEDARPQIDTAMTTMKSLSEDQPRKWREVLGTAGFLELETGSYQKATALLGDAAAKASAYFGSSSREVSVSLERLARAQIADGHLTLAGETLDRALAIANQQHGNFERETANLLCARGMLFALIGKPSVAEPMLERAAKLLNQKLPPRHHSLADVMLDTARLHLQTGHYDKAETESEEAIQIRTERFGDQHRKTAEAVDVLGQVLLSRKDYARAEMQFKRALAIRRKSVGDSHPDTAESWYHLALLAVEQKSLKSALQQLEKSLAIREARLRKDHPATLETREKIEELKSLESAKAPPSDG